MDRQVSMPPPGGPNSAPTSGEPGARIFVWVLWAILVVGWLVFIGGTASGLPIRDDYAIVPVLTGARPVTVGWLWSQHNEHRLPLQRLILLGLLRLSRGDFRVGMVFNVLAMGAAAAGLIAASDRRRDGQRYADAFYPLLLLHPGHQVNFLWAWQIQFTASTALALALLILIARRAEGPNGWGAVGAGVLLSLLPLCGANGLPFVPPLAAWSVVLGFRRLRGKGPRSRSAGWCLLVAPLPALAVTLLYFRGFRRPTSYPTPAGLEAIVMTGARFLSLNLGLAAETLWPISGLLVCGFLLVGAGLLVRAELDQPAERPRSLGLLAFLVGVLGLALGLAQGRAGLGDSVGFLPRYITIATPLLVSIFIICELYAPRALGRFLTTLLFALACVILWPNAQQGLAQARDDVHNLDDFTREMIAGKPMYRLIRRHSGGVHFNLEELAETLPLLRDAGIGPFRSLQGNGALREIPVPLVPISVDMALWNRGDVEVTGVDPWVVFRLPKTDRVAGVRIRYSHQTQGRDFARFQLGWRRPGQSDFPKDQFCYPWELPSGTDRTLTLWIDDVAELIEIQPDNQPCAFRVEAITLLVPDQTPQTDRR